MTGDPDISGEAPQQSDAAFDVILLLWILAGTQGFQVAGAHDVEYAAIVMNGKRPRGTTARVTAGDVRGECEGSNADRVSVLENMVDTSGRVSDDAEPQEKSHRQDDIRVVATMGETVGARFAREQLGTGCFLQHHQSAAVIGMRLGVQEDFDVLDVEAELRDACHDHWRGAGISAVEHDVAFRSGDEESRDIRGADVVEVAGDAERFRWPLSAALCSIQPPADEDQRNKSQQSQQN